MSTTTVFGKQTWFYPVGNTPAVCLTQNMPPGQPADILILGCGDVRNVLFTAHIDNVDRRIDITLCDKQAAVLARNVMILTLILDDSDEVRAKENWDIYYHLQLEQSTCDIVRAQAKKLLVLSSSLNKWNASAYGKHIKFCDSSSLTEIRELWTLYAAEDTDPQLSEAELSLYFTVEKTAKDKVENNNPTAFRSTAPTCTEATLFDTMSLHRRFWRHRDTDEEGKARLDSRANPMFLSTDSNVVIHYGTDPVIGYHLAIPYVALEKEPSASGNAGEGDHLDKIVKSARTQFRKWSASFRQCAAAGSVTVRIFRGDALAFCHVLNHLRITEGTPPANVYRDQHHFEALVLDSVDYVGPDFIAPLSFTTIETSNVADHIGLLNLVVAASPLLSAEPSATLYTEMLERPVGLLEDSVNDLLCGPLVTVATLLGLVQTDHCTNTYTSSPADEEILDFINKVTGGGVMQRFYVRLAWKRPPRLCITPPWPAALLPISFSPKDLASILFTIYDKMFEGDKMGSDVGELMARLAVRGVPITNPEQVNAVIRKLALVTYQRASFAHLLVIVRGRALVDWDMAMTELVRLVNADADTNVNREASKQELYVYMKLLGLHTAEALRINPSIGPLSSKPADVRNWQNAPEVVCLTMSFCRHELSAFGPVTEVGLLPIQCTVASSTDDWHHKFGALQVGFGKLSTSGTEFTDDFEIHVTDDPEGWAGDDRFIVSFMVSTQVLLKEPDGARVMVGILPTINNVAKYRDIFGSQLKICGSSLRDHNRIFLSRNMPNHSGFMKPGGIIDAPFTSPTPAQDSKAVTGFEATHIHGGNIGEIASYIKVLVDELKDRPLDLKLEFLSPFALGIEARGQGSEQPLEIKVNLPMPLGAAVVRLRGQQADGRHMLSFLPATSSPWAVHMAGTYPICFDGRSPVLWNMPYVRLDALPALDVRDRTKLEGIMRHTKLMVNARERAIDDSTPIRSYRTRARLHFKATLSVLFAHFTGVERAQKRIMRLVHKDQTHFIIFMSKLRLDLANRSVVLDAAVLPVSDKGLLQRVTDLTKAMGPDAFVDEDVSEVELDLWRHVLPAYVERGRTWEHRADCEYVKEGRVPRAATADEFSPILCSCGHGVFPEGFVAGVPEWDDVAKLSVRAAISPLFWCPYVERGPDQTSFVATDDHPGPAGGGGAAPQHCRVCGTVVPEGQSNKCPHCGGGIYCSRKCRKDDWKRHKAAECRENRRAA